MISVRNLAKTIDSRYCNANIVVQLGNAGAIFESSIRRNRLLPLLSAMGMVIPTALGISLQSHSTTIAIEGDGSLLMDLGVLSTAYKYAPSNLKILILNNDMYETTGGQKN